MNRLIAFLYLWLFALNGIALDLPDHLKSAENLYRTAGGYGCHLCHGLYGHGANQAGGYIRGANQEILKTALIEQPTMKLLNNVLSDKDMELIANYLIYLGEIPIVSLTVDNMAIGIEVDERRDSEKALQLVLFNAGFSEVTLDLSALGLNTLTIAAQATESLIWSPNSQSEIFDPQVINILP